MSPEPLGDSLLTIFTGLGMCVRAHTTLSTVQREARYPDDVSPPAVTLTHWRRALMLQLLLRSTVEVVVSY